MSLEAAQERHKSVGRNDVCTCGSGKKYKKCHQAEDAATIGAELTRLAEVAEAARAAEKAAAEEAGTDAPKDAPKGKSAGKAAPKKRQTRADAQGKGGSSSGKGSKAKSLPRRAAV